MTDLGSWAAYEIAVLSELNNAVMIYGGIFVSKGITLCPGK